MTTTCSSPTLTTAKVTLVVVPRERFSHTQTSLESLYCHTQVSFDLVYIDGNSPPAVQHYLETQAELKGFQLIRVNHYLSPNFSRNLGLKQVKTPYVVFVDNDVIVSPGWLKTLIACAENHQAAVVGPLVCEQEPVHQHIHCAGGESHILEDAKGRRILREKMYRQGQQLADVQLQLQATETELIEFHCMLVRTNIFNTIPEFDEQMLNTKEHLDFCMAVMALGETVYFEPRSVVTYVPGKPSTWSDLHFYMLRWSDHWTQASLRRLQQKWQIEPNSAYFSNRYKRLNWRRRFYLITPLVRRLSLGFENRILIKFLSLAERPFNAYLVHQNSNAHQAYLSIQNKPAPISKIRLLETNP
ncbi:MAG: glycosyltransferase [Cyanobacteria bacterium P01_D01_bin.56]